MPDARPVCIERTDAILATLREVVGGCREDTEPTGEPGSGRCAAPAEYVLWGKLIPPEGLGPRCYDCASKHVPYWALAPGSNFALINLIEMARMIALGQEGPQDA